MTEVLRRATDNRLNFRCPGCKDVHSIPVEAPNSSGACWTWNGSMERPTFYPSVKVESGHYCSNHKPEDGCWCTFNADPENADIKADSRFACYRCHSFVKEGMIEFLSDCTHALAGKTVPLEPF